MIPLIYEDNIYNKLYTEKIKEEIHYRYHAYKVRIIFKLDNKTVKTTLSSLYISNHFPATFTIKSKSFNSLWDFIDNNRNFIFFTGANRYKPDKFHKERRFDFCDVDCRPKPWKEGQEHTWELTREIIIEYPSIKMLEESRETVERIVPYITERMGW